MATNQRQQNIDRLPPQDIEAEMSVLGSILMDKEALFKVVDTLSPPDFYIDGHKIIYETMIELSEKSQPTDILSVGSKLKEKKVMKKIGGQSTLTKLVNSVPSASHVVHYANIVQKKSLLRKMIEASYDIAELGYREEEEVDILLDEAEKKVFQISERINSQNFLPIKSHLEDAFERIDNLSKNTGELRGVPTGFTGLDNHLAGLQKADLVILAARPSLGKSSLALDIARGAAKNTPVGIFSLEMSRDQIVDRFIAADANLDLWKLRTGKKLSDNDFTKIQTAMGNLSESSIYIDDGLTSSVLQMRAMARRLQAEKGLGLLIIDYLQLIQPRTISDSMVQQITEISRALKALARELDIPVLALSQLSRAVEQRPDKTPKLSDLRDSGSIEQDADVVLFISRDVRNEEDNTAEIHIAKHRNGPIGKVQMIFDKNSASFRDPERYRVAPEDNTGEYTSYKNSIPPQDEEPGTTSMDDIPS